MWHYFLSCFKRKFFACLRTLDQRYVNCCTIFLPMQAEKAQQREKNLEEAKKVTIEEDKSLPEAKAVRIIQNEAHCSLCMGVSD